MGLIRQQDIEVMEWGGPFDPHRPVVPAAAGSLPLHPGVYRLRALVEAPREEVEARFGGPPGAGLPFGEPGCDSGKCVP